MVQKVCIKMLNIQDGTEKIFLFDIGFIASFHCNKKTNQTALRSNSLYNICEGRNNAGNVIYNRFDRPNHQLQMNYGRTWNGI